MCSSKKCCVNNINNCDKKLWNPMEVRWGEVKSESIYYVWNKIPQRLQPVIVTLCIFIFGISLKGCLDELYFLMFLNVVFIFFTEQ